MTVFEVNESKHFDRFYTYPGKPTTEVDKNRFSPAVISKETDLAEVNQSFYLVNKLDYKPVHFQVAI